MAKLICYNSKAKDNVQTRIGKTIFPILVQHPNAPESVILSILSEVKKGRYGEGYMAYYLNNTLSNSNIGEEFIQKVYDTFIDMISLIILLESARRAS